MSRTIFSVLLLLNLYLAKVSIIDLSAANGFHETLLHHLQDEPVQFTSLRPLDSLLTMLVRFFQPSVAGNDVPLTLFSIFMAGQLMALYMLLIVEGMRFANRGKLISYSSIWGVAFQLVTIGVTFPVYFLAWIWTSSIPEAANDPGFFADAISINEVQGSAVTGAWILGTFLPTLLAGLPSPRIISEHTQELALAIWQAFPLWTSFAHFCLAKLVSSLDLVPKAIHGKPETKIGRFNKIYSYALVPVVVINVGLFGYMYLKANTMGLSPVELALETFRPTWPWNTACIISIEKGSLTLLQWDAYCSLLATWIWIAYVTYATGGIGRMAVALGQLLVLATVLGPCGAALVVVWRRDITTIQVGMGEKKIK